MAAQLEDEEIFHYLNQVAEFKKISEFMHDEDIDHVLAQVVKIVQKPNIPPEVVDILIVMLSAMSAKFTMISCDYMYISKSGAGARERKSIYRTAAASLDNLVNALKFPARNK